MSEPEVNPIDCICTDEITCPYCGHVHGDSWDHEPDNSEIECDGCGKEFEYFRSKSVSYSTYKRKGEPE
jgi:uncharacterized Zn-finger protein